MYIVYEKETGRITCYTDFEDQAFSTEGHDILVTEENIDLFKNHEIRVMVDVKNKKLVKDPDFVYVPIDPNADI